MEKRTYKGVDITIETRPTASQPGTDIVLTGPSKRWEFWIIQLAGPSAGGYIRNLPNGRQKAKGETTALAVVGMQELAKYAQANNVSFTYLFKTENPNLRRWYLKRGKKALGIREKGINMLGRVVGRRVFTPDTLNNPKGIVGLGLATARRLLKNSFPQTTFRSH